MVPIKLPQSPNLRIILSAEAAAAFDELTRSGADDEMVRQIRNAWPNTFREARFIPAVEYIQANRHRRLLIEDFHQVISQYDVILTPTFGGSQLGVTNLTGHPVLAIPSGFDETNHPTSISILGNLFDEEKILLLGDAIQQQTDHHLKHPPGFE